MIWIVCYSISCGNKAESTIVEVAADNTKFYEVLFNEAMEVDSVLLNGKLPVVCSIDSVINLFGEVLEVYNDYRFSFDQFSDKKIKHYVFKDAIFREWSKDQLILVTIALREGNFISYSGEQFTIGNARILRRFFPEHIDVELWRNERVRSSNSATSIVFCVPTSKRAGKYDRMKWIFNILGDGFVSLELYNPYVKAY
jgi:hypothetical protein